MTIDHSAFSTNLSGLVRMVLIAFATITLITAPASAQHFDEDYWCRRSNASDPAPVFRFENSHLHYVAPFEVDELSSQGVKLNRTEIEDSRIVGLLLASLVIFVAIWAFYLFFRIRSVPDQARDRIQFSIGGGVAMGSQAYSETHIRSHTTGGGGYVHPTAGGYVSPSKTHVSSTTVEQRTFFLVRDDGTEISVSDARSFPTRDGQRLGVVYGTLDQTETKVIAMYNFATQRDVLFESNINWLIYRILDYPTMAIAAFVAIIFVVSALAMVNIFAAIILSGALGAALFFSFKFFWHWQSTRHIKQGVVEALATMRETRASAESQLSVPGGAATPDRLS